MRLGGIVGEVEYRNLDPTSYKFLKLAELIGVGKQTVFGLGKVKVEKVAVLSEVA
jgi:CRISPR/Cas system endoribonuclease Cas6 (RAMP superfamily)